MGFTLIRCGKLYDGLQDTLQADMEIIVEDDRIREVGKKLACPEGAVLHDLSATLVTPGLIDAHIHTENFSNFKDDVYTLFRSDEWKTLAALYCAGQSLRHGFTTLRVPGVFVGDSYGLADVRRAIDGGYFPGARLNISFFALGGSGGHSDVTQDLRENPRMADIWEEHLPAVANGPDAFRKIVRRQIKYGADFIKIMATGGFGSPYDAPDDFHLAEDEMAAIIDTAHQLGKPVTAHAIAPAQIKMLVALGVDGIEHGSLLDEDTIRLMEERDVYLVPTIGVFEPLLDEEKLAKRNHYAQQKMRRHGGQMRKTVELVRQSRLRLGYGTDFMAGCECYESGYEYGAFLRAGYDPFRALAAATRVNAGIVGNADIGAIAPGKLADIAAFDTTDVADENALMNCTFAMKGGQVTCEKQGLVDSHD